MKKVSFESNKDLSLSERDLRAIISSLDDYFIFLRSHRCYSDASYVDRLNRKFKKCLLG